MEIIKENDMTLENEKRFLLLLSSYHIGKSPTKKEVLDLLINKEWMEFSKDDLEIKKNRNELVWRNDLAFIRKHLVQEGCFDGTIKNNWAVTQKGINYLYILSGKVCSEKYFRKISAFALEEAKKLYNKKKISII